MFSGIPNDINNSISLLDVYAYQADYPVDIGAPDSTRTQTAPNNDSPSTGSQAVATIPGNPAKWWIVFALVFFGFVFIARRFGGQSEYGNIKASVYNGLFLTFFIVLILNALKRIAAVTPPNPVSALILAA